MGKKSICEFCGEECGKAYHSCSQARDHRDLTGKGYRVVESRKHHTMYEHPTDSEKSVMVFKKGA